MISMDCRCSARALMTGLRQISPAINREDPRGYGRSVNGGQTVYSLKSHDAIGSKLRYISAVWRGECRRTRGTGVRQWGLVAKPKLFL